MDSFLEQMLQPNVDLAAIARALGKAARQFEDQSKVNATRQTARSASRERIRRRRRYLKDVTEQMQRQLQQGHPLDAVLAATHTKTQVAIEYLQELLRRDLGHRRRQRGARNRRIMQMRAQGLSNSKIAEAVGLHEKSVARIIGAELKRAGLRIGQGVFQPLYSGLHHVTFEGTAG